MSANPVVTGARAHLEHLLIMAEAFTVNGETGAGIWDNGEPTAEMVGGSCAVGVMKRMRTDMTVCAP